MPARPSSVKLTVHLDRRTAEAAKRYARARGTSVSRMVAELLRTVTRSPADAEPEAWEAALSPATRRLLERPPAPDVSDDDYYRHLERKHR